MTSSAAATDRRGTVTLQQALIEIRSADKLWRNWLAMDAGLWYRRRRLLTGSEFFIDQFLKGLWRLRATQEDAVDEETGSTDHARAQTVVTILLDRCFVSAAIEAGREATLV